MARKPRDGKVCSCSFCGHTQDEVHRLVAGQEPGVFICNDCVELCSELLKEEKEEEEGVSAKHEGAVVPEVSAELEGRIDTARGSGEVLPEHIRESFEPQFGSDFSNVRVGS